MIQFQWNGIALVTGQTVQRPTVFPVGKLGRCPLRIARIRKLSEDAPKIAFGRLLIAGQRPAFGEAREIFATIVLAEVVEGWLSKRQRSFEIGGRFLRKLAPARVIPLGTGHSQQHSRAW